MISLCTWKPRNFNYLRKNTSNPSRSSNQILCRHKLDSCPIKRILQGQSSRVNSEHRLTPMHTQFRPISSLCSGRIRHSFLQSCSSHQCNLPLSTFSRWCPQCSSLGRHSCLHWVPPALACTAYCCTGRASMSHHRFLRKSRSRPYYSLSGRRMSQGQWTCHNST